jgi:hypothetical protein
VNKRKILVSVGATAACLAFIFIRLERASASKEDTWLWTEKISQLKLGDDIQEIQKKFENEIERKNELFGFTFFKLKAPTNAIDTPYIVFERDGKLVLARFNRDLKIGEMPPRFDLAVDSVVSEEANKNAMNTLGIKGTLTNPKK